MTTYHLTLSRQLASMSYFPVLSTEGIDLESPEEFARVKELCEDRTHMAGFWKQTVMPIRTNQSSDILFPTLMNLIMRSTQVTDSAFKVLAAIIWDVATLPIRLITYLPRTLYLRHAEHQEHPLLTFLQEKGLPLERLMEGIPLDLEKGAHIVAYCYQRTVIDQVGHDEGEVYELHLGTHEVPLPMPRRSQRSMKNPSTAAPSD